MKTLAIVPARGGSRGIPRKNVRLWRGKPLLAHAIEVGRATCGMVAVSSDDPGILTHAGVYRAIPLMRPPWLAEDETPMLPVLRHAVEALGVSYGVVVLLQPTQPLRKPEHVRAALEMLEAEPGASSVVSVVQIPASHSPDYVLRHNGSGLEPFCGCKHRQYDHDPWPHLDEMPSRRQDAEPAFYRDGTVYAIRRETLEAGTLYGDRCLPLHVPAHESVTLDTEADWQRAVSMVS